MSLLRSSPDSALYLVTFVDGAKREVDLELRYWDEQWVYKLLDRADAKMASLFEAWRVRTLGLLAVITVTYLLAILTASAIVSSRTQRGARPLRWNWVFGSYIAVVAFVCVLGVIGPLREVRVEYRWVLPLTLIVPMALTWLVSGRRKH